MSDKPVDRSIDDSTLGGYLKRHDRPPAFEGSDGRAYSVGIHVDPEPASEGRYAASLLFVRWSEAGDSPEGHVETGDLGFGETTRAAAAALHPLTLIEIKEHLERAIERAAEWPDG